MPQRASLADLAVEDREIDSLQRWVWSQRWQDVMFLHWRVPPAVLRPHVPNDLEIETHGEFAWLSLVLFRLQVRPCWLPYLPGLSSLVEMNLRTYVSWRDRPGICFLSVHADNRWAMFLARLFTPLPYVSAQIDYPPLNNGFRLSANRKNGESVRLSLAFRADSEKEETQPGTLDFWLLERYRLFVQDAREQVLQAEVVHPRWVVSPLGVSVAANTLGEKFGVDLGRPPDRAHFSTGVEARFGAFQRVT